MSIHRSLVRLVAACVLLLIFTGTAAGCSSDTSGETSVTLDGIVVTTQRTTTTSLPQLSELDRELAATARAQNQLSQMLLEQGADDDPRQAIIYGLRARAQALTSRKALDRGNLEVADAGIKDIRFMMNLARDIAVEPVAQILVNARSIIDTLGLPSDAPEQAATTLDEFIAKLSALLDEAATLTQSTTSS